MFTYAQTNLQLYRQLEAEGYGEYLPLFEAKRAQR